MADRGLIHYQSLTGPVWREPVASRLAWLPRGEPARLLERRTPSESVYSPFYELYQPSSLSWLPSGRWPVYPEVRKLGDFQQPPFQVLYKPEGLQWLFEGQLSVRAIQYTSQSFWVVDPAPVVAVAFDPQFFPFQATDIILSRMLQATIQSAYATPPLPPGPDVVVTIPSVGGGASGAKRYRAPAWWGDEQKKKLEKKVGAVQKLIQKKREQIDFAPDLYRMERLIEQLQELQKRLMKLLEQIDELNKQAGEQEILEVYLIYRSLH